MSVTQRIFLRANGHSGRQTQHQRGANKARTQSSPTPPHKVLCTLPRTGTLPPLLAARGQGPWLMTITPDSRRVSSRLPEAADGAGWARIFLVLTVAAAGMAALLALFPAAGHDQLWFLLMARRWLGGAPLYGPEIFDSNPPGIVWLSVLPVLLSKLLHWPATSAGKLLVVVAEAGSLWVALAFLRRGWRKERRDEFWALLFAAVVLFGVVPARDFGQRDHMAGFLLLPYVLAAATDWRAPGLLRWKIAAGVMAAVGVCLKPHQVLVVLAMALLNLPLGRRGEGLSVRERMRFVLRPELVTVVICGALFLGAVRWCAPLYFASALPITRETYWAIGHLSVTQLLWEAVELCVLNTVALAVWASECPRYGAVFYLLIAGEAATLAYLLQGTGWYYQQLPALTMFGVALVLQWLDIARRKQWQAPRWMLPAIAALSLLAAGLTMHFTGYPFTADRAFAIETPDPAFFSGLAPGTPVATLTTSVDEAMMPVERYHLTWAQRTNNLWLMPAIFRSESPAQGEPPRRVLLKARVADLDAMQHRWMVEDLQRWRPAIVLVERCQDAGVQCQELEDRHDDLLAWFLRDPAFATVWRSYQFSGTRGRFDAYVLKQ